MSSSKPVITLILSTLVLTACSKPATLVTVDKQPCIITSSDKTDSAPAKQPLFKGASVQMNACDTGNVNAKFVCKPEYVFAVDNTSSGGNGNWAVRLLIKSAHMVLSLPVTVTVNDGANTAQKAHLEGHAAICKQSYDDHAERVAAECAQSMVGKICSGQGSDIPSARKKAEDEAVDELQELYRDRLAPLVSTTQDRFDAITKNGAGDVPVADAVKQAVQAAASPAPK